MEVLVKCQCFLIYLKNYYMYCISCILGDVSILELISNQDTVYTHNPLYCFRMRWQRNQKIWKTMHKVKYRQIIEEEFLRHCSANLLYRPLSKRELFLFARWSLKCTSTEGEIELTYPMGVL